MKTANRQTVLGLGELLWDCFPDERRPGGAPANVAFHAAQLGHRGVIGSRVGRDAPGRALLEYLERRGLSTELIQVDDRRETGRVTVSTADPANPAYVIHENAAWDAIDLVPRLEQTAREAAAICVGTLAQRSAGSRETIRRCLEAGSGALCAFDVNLRQSWYRREWIEATLRLVKLVKLNLDEVTLLAGLLETADGRPEPFGRELIRRYGVELVCVTRAERGCMLIAASETHDVPGRPVRVADAVGAGDAFTAALLSARLRGWPLERAGRFANEVGALVASKSGAMPDMREDYAALLTGNPA